MSSTHWGDNKDYSLPVCDAVQSVTNLPAFQRNLQLQFSVTLLRQWNFVYTSVNFYQTALRGIPQYNLHKLHLRCGDEPLFHKTGNCGPDEEMFITNSAPLSNSNSDFQTRFDLRNPPKRAIPRYRITRPAPEVLLLQSRLHCNPSKTILSDSSLVQHIPCT
jgi:hypothetical protein